MKTYLYDCTNFGVLYIYDEPFKSGWVTSVEKSNWILSILRSCILDTRVDRLQIGDPSYDVFTNQTILNNIYITNLSGSVYQGNPQESNEIFVKKRQQAQLIAPIAIYLVNAIYSRLLNGMVNRIGVDIYDTLAIEISNSNPEENQYTPGIIDYANTLGITPSQAYAEIKLECETFNSLKMRAYAVSKKYQVLIRQVTDQKQADSLINEIHQKLIADTRI